MIEVGDLYMYLPRNVWNNALLRPEAAVQRLRLGPKRSALFTAIAEAEKVA